MPDPSIPGGSANEEEARTTHAVSLMRALTGFSGYQFNPQALVKTTNVLHGLGRDAALGVLRSYCTLAERTTGANSENALLVARALFVRKDGQKVLPRLPLGQPDFAEPLDPAILPLFPLYIHQDLPFLLIAGYMVGGEALPPSEYIEWCMRECDIRPTPFVPADDPLASVDQFLESDVWKGLNPSNAHYGMLRLQALRAVSNVYPMGKEDEAGLLSSATSNEMWQKHRRAIGLLHIRWNLEKNEYELKKAGETFA